MSTSFECRFIYGRAGNMLYVQTQSVPQIGSVMVFEMPKGTPALHLRVKRIEYQCWANQGSVRYFIGEPWVYCDVIRAKKAQP